jgi:hypothetical protein
LIQRWLVPKAYMHIASTLRSRNWLPPMLSALLNEATEAGHLASEGDAHLLLHRKGKRAE